MLGTDVLPWLNVGPSISQRKKIDEMSSEKWSMRTLKSNSVTPPTVVWYITGPKLADPSICYQRAMLYSVLLV